MVRKPSFSSTTGLSAQNRVSCAPSTRRANLSSRRSRRTAPGKGGGSTSMAASITTRTHGSFACGTSRAWAAGQQQRAPGLRERQGDIVLYATSADGIHWEKPNLGRHEFDGSRDNNILFFDKHSPTVIVDADAAPDQRYKMACWNWERITVATGSRIRLMDWTGASTRATPSSWTTTKSWKRSPWPASRVQASTSPFIAAGGRCGVTHGGSSRLPRARISWRGTAMT